MVFLNILFASIFFFSTAQAELTVTYSPPLIVGLVERFTINNGASDVTSNYIIQSIAPDPVSGYTPAKNSTAFRASVPGSYLITFFNTSDLTTFTNTAFYTAVPAYIQLMSGANQSASTGSPLAQPIKVQVSDANGNLISGATVSWSITGSGGTFSSSTTDSTGIAATTLTMGSMPGIYSVTATAGTISTGESIQEIANPTTNQLSNLTFQTQPSPLAQQNIIFPSQPILSLTNGSGAAYNISTPVSVAVFKNSSCTTPASGNLGGTTNINSSSGVATFTNLTYPTNEAIFLKFTAGSLNVCSDQVSVSQPASSATKLALNFTPTSSYTQMQFNLLVNVTDGAGNIIVASNSPVSLAAYTDASCSTAATGTLSNATGINSYQGQALFNSLIYSNVETIYIKASSIGLTPICSTGIQIKANPIYTLTSLAFYSAPSTEFSGQLFGVQPFTYVKNSLGTIYQGPTSIPITIAAYTDSACSIAAPGTLSGGTVNNSIFGVGAYTNLGYSASGTIYLGISSPGLISACSSGVTMTPTAASLAAKLKFSIAPSTSAVLNTFLTTQPAIEVDDSSGIVVSGTQGYVTLNWYTDSTCSTPAAGAGEGSARIVSGIAQFSFVGSASVGVFYLKGSYNNIIPVCSSAITVASNAPAFAYTSPVSYFKNQPISISPTSPVSNITSCLASPPLPTGLIISPTTCIISGTVSTTSPSTTYTVTASNGGAGTTATISISIATALSSVISTSAIANELLPISTSGGTPPYTAQIISGTGTLNGSSPSFSYRHSIFGAEVAQIKITDSQGSIVNLTSTSTEAALSSLSLDSSSGIACASAPFDSSGTKMACWGSLGSTFLNLPSDTAGANGFYPFQKTSGLLINASNISLGSSFGVYSIGGNTIWAWGKNDYGQLGSALGTDKYLTPVTVHLESGATAQSIKKLSAGRDFACVAFDQDSTIQGKVSCWGNNVGGKSGAPIANSTTTATSILGLGVSGFFGVATDIALGRDHGCAQQSSNASNTTNAYIKCWGSNFYGQLGNNTNTDSYTAVTPIGLSVSGTTAATPLYRIAVGDNHSCAEANSKVWCWGNNASYQIGTTSATTIKSPFLFGTFSGITAIGAGSNHTCFATGNTVRCWGSNSAGQLGVIPSAIPSGQTSSPQSVTLSDNVSALVIKGDSTCAVLATGATYCWGKNTSNMLGTSALADSYLPRKMSIIPSETVSCPAVNSPLGGFVKDLNGSCVCATAGYTFDPATPYCHPQCGFFQVWNPYSNSCGPGGGSF